LQLTQLSAPLKQGYASFIFSSFAIIVDHLYAHHSTSCFF
jgi:hypothetical protein